MTPAPPAPRALLPPAVWAVMAVCAGIEAVLMAADHGLIGSARWRPLAYANGAFWAGLLRGWTPNYAGQPVLMFVTHAFLHAGFSHLAGNMLGLAGLGPLAAERLGARGFLALYAVAALGGGLAFGLLGPVAAPMVGASGAVFGLAAAWVVWDWQDRRRRGLGRARALLRPVAVALVLVLFNAVVWVTTGGQLAWETHLGGFAAGALFAARYPRPVPPPILAKMRA